MASPSHTGRNRPAHTFFLALLFTFLAAAATAQAPPPVTDYVVGPQDVLTITSYDQADLSGKFTVEADGTFTFPLIGRFKGGGLTCGRSRTA